ncbi:MAG TPA: glycosyltransferase family 4 protein [Thermoleophilaceae bacterium]|nr:glycosyltransferase family 4 protein [Thermoleophilaceae bacterium]
MIEIAYVCNELGIGGTERGLANHARSLDRDRYRARAIGVHALGARADGLRAAGIQVDCADGDHDRLVELLRGADVVHLFRSGTTEAPALGAAIAAAPRAIVETKTFGMVDRSPEARRIDCHLLISKMNAVRYRALVGAPGPEFHARHRVLPQPLDLADLQRSAPERAVARRSLGLDPDRPVICRVGRADDSKWRDLLVDMVPRLLDLRPDAQVLLVGATEAKRERLRRRGVLERCTLIAPTADEGRVAGFYAASDVFVNASELGESQGLVIGEAMALGLPVVTCSTPWVDNAQIEFVEHGRTGLVANHPNAFAEAVASLLDQPQLARRLGAAGQEDVRRMLDVSVVTAQLERLYDSLLATGAPPPKWSPAPEEVDAFEAEYERRLGLEFRPLTPRERVGARVRRELEFARRLRGLVRKDALPLAWGMARAKLLAGRPTRGGTAR